MSNSPTAIILAGGQSKRMGSDKGLMLFRSKTLVSYVIDALRSVTSNIIIVTSNKEYQQFGFKCIEDEFANKGPLAGIYTGLKNSSSEKNILVGCDMPFLSTSLLTNLLINAGNEDVLLSHHNQMPEPLCSVYDRKSIFHIRNCLDKNQLKITDALSGLHVRNISFDKEDWFRGDEYSNINTPELLRQLESSS